MGLFKKIFGMKDDSDPRVTVEISISGGPENRSPEEEKIYGLKRKATSYKREKDYGAALKCLKDAIGLTEKLGFEPSLSDGLRYAAYLQADGQNDAAWGEFNRLLTVYFASDVALSDIYDKMRLFLQREGRNVLAVRFGVWAHLYKTKAYYTELTGHSEKIIQELRASGLDMDEELKKGILETEQYSIDNAKKWIRILKSEESIDDLCGKLLKKAEQEGKYAKLKEIVMHHLERLPDLSAEKVAKEVDALFV